VLVQFWLGTYYAGAKIHILSKKFHILKIPIFTKFTFQKFHFSQNSHFYNLNFNKILIFEISFITKFTFLKYQFSQNSHFWSIKIKGISEYKRVYLPQCAFSDIWPQNLDTESDWTELFVQLLTDDGICYTQLFFRQFTQPRRIKQISKRERANQDLDSGQVGRFVFSPQFQIGDISVDTKRAHLLFERSCSRQKCQILHKYELERYLHVVRTWFVVRDVTSTMTAADFVNHDLFKLIIIDVRGCVSPLPSTTCPTV